METTWEDIISQIEPQRTPGLTWNAGGGDENTSAPAEPGLRWTRDAGDVMTERYSV